MTRLRKMMLEELERRNYSEATTRCYIRTVEDFSRRFKRSPDRLGPEHIREYQAELFKKRKLSPGAVTQRLAALRFFYIKTLKKSWSIAETPYPKRAFPPSFDPQPGRSRATHRRSSDSLSSHSVDGSRKTSLGTVKLLASPQLSQENLPAQRSLPPRVSRLCSAARPSLPLDELP